MQVQRANARAGCGGIPTSHKHCPEMTRSPFACSGLRQSLPVAGAIIISLVCQSAGLAAPNAMVAVIDDRQNADRLLVVDCMLPGQVRQLGTGITYMAPRRAIKTNGSECAIRGGEHDVDERSDHCT